MKTMLFDFIWKGDPIDFFNGAEVAFEEMRGMILGQMEELSETPGSDVYTIYLPYENRLVAVHMCKALNNGTTYYFSGYDVMSYFRNWRIVKNG